MYYNLKEYISKGELSEVDEAVFATTRPPHVQASQDTLTRHMRAKLSGMGIDTTSFTPNSCRHAATSMVSRQTIPLAMVLLIAGWSVEDVQHHSLEPFSHTNHLVWPHT